MAESVAYKTDKLDILWLQLLTGVPEMELPKIIEVSRMSDGVLVTFADGMVTRLTLEVLYAAAIDPDSLPKFFTNETA